MNERLPSGDIVINGDVHHPDDDPDSVAILDITDSQQDDEPVEVSPQGSDVAAEIAKPALYLVTSESSLVNEEPTGSEFTDAEWAEIERLSNSMSYADAKRKIKAS